MKKLRPLLIFILALFILSCSDEEPATIKKEKVQFSITPTVGDESGGRLNEELPEGSSLIITLSNSSGVVFDKHRVNIFNFSGSFITEPLEMSLGNYTIQDFLIVDERNTVLYATPKAGSLLTSAVKRPLPTRFNVSRGTLNTLDMEVLAVGDLTAADFGYASFSITVADYNPLSIAVFIEQNDELILTNATGYIYQADLDQSIQTLNLAAKVNVINFHGDKSLEHRIRIKKSGYDVSSKPFIYNDLLASGNNTVVVVIK